MLRFLLFITGGLAALLSSAYSQNYIWPINTGRYLTSTFGEYRPGHFHSGIDIKTNYRCGYPVYATADGYIWRVLTSPYGYGKAVYLKLDDGNLAVYGHLDRFGDRIVPHLRAEQQRRQRYSADIYFNPRQLPVRRGEIIAYSGDTGTLHPHLHFEIRDAANRPFNPLNTNLKIDDQTIPTISAVAFTPLTPDSRINGSSLIRIFPAHYQARKQFALTDSVEVCGIVGISVKTYDTVRGLPNKYAPYRITLTVDSLVLFRAVYDTFDFAETGLISLDRDYQLRQEGNGHFNRLWRLDSVPPLPFYKTSHNGWLDLTTGRHTAQIDVSDHNGNTATLRFPIQSVESFPVLTLSGHGVADARLKIDLLINGGDIRPELSGRWINRYGFESRAAGLTIARLDSSTITLFTDWPQPGDEWLEINALAAKGNAIQPVYVNPSPPAQRPLPEPQVTWIHYPRSMMGQIRFREAPVGEIQFYLQTHDDLYSLPLIRTTGTEWMVTPLARDIWDHALAFEVRLPGEPHLIQRQTLRMTAIKPRRAAMSATADSALVVHWPVGSVFDTLVCWIDPLPAPPVAGGKALGPAYRINPLSQPLARKITLSFKTPTRPDSTKRAGIYQWSEDKWSLAGMDDSSASGRVNARTDQLGIFGLLQDETPPLITDLFPGNGGRFRAADVTQLKASVKDDLSGLRDDRSIQMKLDDRLLIAEYHGVQHYVRFFLTEALSPGDHTMEITAVDQAGNTARQLSRFTILTDRP